MAESILKNGIKPGVVYGEQLVRLFEICKSEGFALPAVNCVNTESVNGTLEAAAKVNSPVIIQFSNGGSIFYAGKGLKTEEKRPDVIWRYKCSSTYPQCSFFLWCACNITYRSLCKEIVTLVGWSFGSRGIILRDSWPPIIQLTHVRSI